MVEKVDWAGFGADEGLLLPSQCFNFATYVKMATPSEDMNGWVSPTSVRRKTRARQSTLLQQPIRLRFLHGLEPSLRSLLTQKAHHAFNVVKPHFQKWIVGVERKAQQDV